MDITLTPDTIRSILEGQMGWDRIDSSVFLRLATNTNTQRLLLEIVHCDMLIGEGDTDVLEVNEAKEHRDNAKSQLWLSDDAEVGEEELEELLEDMGLNKVELDAETLRAIVVTRSPLEVSPCRESSEGGVNVCSEEEAQFWSVYARDKEGLARCLADFPTKSEAWDFFHMYNHN